MRLARDDLLDGPKVLQGPVGLRLRLGLFELVLEERVASDEASLYCEGREALNRRDVLVARICTVAVRTLFQLLDPPRPEFIEKAYIGLGLAAQRRRIHQYKHDASMWPRLLWSRRQTSFRG